MKTATKTDERVRIMDEIINGMQVTWQTYFNFLILSMKINYLIVLAMLLAERARFPQLAVGDVLLIHRNSSTRMRSKKSLRKKNMTTMLYYVSP